MSFPSKNYDDDGTELIALETSRLVHRPTTHCKLLITDGNSRDRLLTLYRCAEGAESFSIANADPVERRFVRKPVF
jgi:hypothetical protein